MPASSLIFLLILFICAGYLVPAAIRRRRHTEQARLEDRDSAALRVVVRGGSVGLTAGDAAPLAGASSRPVLGSGFVGARQVSAPVGSTAPAAAVASPAVVLPPSASVEVTTAPVTRAAVRRPVSARVVARRQRLVGTVLGLTLLAWGGVAAGVVPWWVALVPTFVAGFVVAALTRHGAAAPVRTAPGVRVVVESPRDHLVPDADADNDTVAVPGAGSAARPREWSAPAASPTRSGAAGPDADDGSWAPVPVPLPTYLLKPKAPPRPAVVVEAAEPAAAGEPSVEEPVQVIDLRQQVRAANG